jgi:hypothetical protein
LLPRETLNGGFTAMVLVKKTLNVAWKTLILPDVLYGCETWSLTLKEENRLKVFENRVMKIFGPKREEVIRG